MSAGTGGTTATIGRYKRLAIRLCVADAYYSDACIAAQGSDLAPHERCLDAFLEGTGPLS